MKTTALTPAMECMPATVTEQKGMKANYRWVSVTEKPSAAAGMPKL